MNKCATFIAPRIAFAVPMYWIMDVTINILQTPYRALVSDLATKEQQIPMQVIDGSLGAVHGVVAPTKPQQLYDTVLITSLNNCFKPYAFIKHIASMYNINV